MKKAVFGALVSTLMISSMAKAGNGDVDSATVFGEMTCAVSYGSGQNLVEFQINLSAKKGKVVFMNVRDEAQRDLTFVDEEIMSSDKKELAKGAHYPEAVLYTITARTKGDMIEIAIPAQNPLSNTVTAYVVTNSKTLNARIPMEKPATAICDKH